MRVALISPDWGNSWKPSLTEAFESKRHEVYWATKPSDLASITFWADIVLSMWADETAIQLSNTLNKPFYTYIRAYEMFTDMPARINWKNTRGVLYCNNNTASIANKLLNEAYPPGLPKHIVHNWVDVDEYQFSEHVDGYKIAMLCDLNFKKNIPMALQILLELPEAYTLHIAGACQDASLMEYMSNLVVDSDIQHRVKMYNRIPHKDIVDFMSDKNYILSTSMREGCPMGILECMSMGVKPIVHNWPGAKDIFPEDIVFSKISEVIDILNKPYNSRNYRDLVEKNHGLNNARRVVDIVTN